MKIKAFIYNSNKILIFLMLTLYGCKENTDYKPSYSQSKNEKKKTLTIGCANRAFYEPLDLTVQLLNKRLKSVQLKMVAAANYEDFLTKMQQGVYDITYTNGLEALKEQKKGYNIAAKFESDSTYYSVIFTPKNSDIKKIKDLKNKKMALSGKNSILGDLAPMVFLYKNGINGYKDLKLEYFPSFEAGILNVYLGKCDAGVSWVTSWNNYIRQHPKILKKLEVKWQTPPHQNVCIIIKKNVDPKISSEIVNLFLNLHKDPNGKKALQAMSFTKVIKANSNTYAPMKKLQEEFERIPK